MRKSKKSFEYESIFDKLSEEEKNRFKVLPRFMANSEVKCNDQPVYEVFKYVIEKIALESRSQNSSSWEQIQIKADVKGFEDEILHSLGALK